MTVIQGGFLKAPWCIQMTEPLPGHFFYKLLTADRSLAAALGKDVSTPNPMSGVDLFNYLSRQRDAVVDKLIHEHQMKNDPMANEDVAVTRVTKGRESLYNAADIPLTLAIVMPSFRDEHRGLDVHEITLNVLATSKRGTAPAIEITEGVLEWLCHATKQTWIRDRKRVACSTLDFGFALPILPSGIKYRKRGGAISLCASYSDADGKWGSHQKTICNRSPESQEAFEVMLQPVLASMQAFLDDNDHDIVNEDVDATAPELAADDTQNSSSQV